MRLHHCLTLILAFATASCSHFKMERFSFTNKKISDPAVELGIKSDDLKEMVSKAKVAGGMAAQFLASDLFIKANDASIRGDYQTASNILKYVVELAPQDIFLKRKLSIELIRVGELKEAESILENVFKESKYKDDSIGLILAGVYAALEKPSLARATYQKIIATSSDVEEACLFLAKSYFAEKKYNDAHKLLASCEKKSKDPVYSFYRGKMEFDRGHKVAAKAFFEKSMKIDPSYAQAVLGLGTYYEDREQVAKATSVYKKFLAAEGNANNVPVLSRLVSLLFATDSTDEVVGYAETLSSLDGTDLNLKVRLGLLYSEAARYEEATNLFKEVLEVVPESDKVIYYLGALYQQTNKYPEAVEYFKKIPNTSVLFGDAGVQISQMYSILAKEEFLQGKKEGAAYKRLSGFISERVKDHEESTVDLKLILANYFEDTVELKKSIAVLNEIKGNKAFNESHSYYFASVLEKDGQSREARGMVQAILDKDPNNAHALNFLGYSYLEKNEKLDLAFDYISKAVKLRPDDGYIRDSLAWYFYQTGKYKEALTEAKKAFELVKTDVIITKHLAMIYQRLQNFDKAKEYLTEALKQAKVPTDREDVLKLITDIENTRLPASESN